jgi:hypothetical protein
LAAARGTEWILGLVLAAPLDAVVGAIVGMLVFFALLVALANGIIPGPDYIRRLLRRRRSERGKDQGIGVEGADSESDGRGTSP